MQFCPAPVGPGPTKIVEEDNQIYNTAGIEARISGWYGSNLQHR
jgi:hypothetical protein